ncbi:tyrosine-type recombinase/integrase [Hassallia byssoidea VB512170]|uniref:Tyrosine-type recombinase/integrase n=1 Tax=Hassallia byssoidea VB512170 TaxID=1304833 RepID=A0A846HDR7_9CYAN|nr:tyrosine-type recombinase/integrase [Hassalia byssoidea VB512170]
MINNGVPQHIVQRYLGHESPTMTATYAYIFDKTLKNEFIKFKDKIVDVTGKTISQDAIVQ